MEENNKACFPGPCGTSAHPQIVRSAGTFAVSSAEEREASDESLRKGIYTCVDHAAGERQGREREDERGKEGKRREREERKAEREGTFHNRLSLENGHSLLVVTSL